jgi:hypothetical protein
MGHARHRGIMVGLMDKHHFTAVIASRIRNCTSILQNRSELEVQEILKWAGLSTSASLHFVPHQDQSFGRMAQEKTSRVWKPL